MELRVVLLIVFCAPSLPTEAEDGDGLRHFLDPKSGNLRVNGVEPIHIVTILRGLRENKLGIFPWKGGGVRRCSDFQCCPNHLRCCIKDTCCSSYVVMPTIGCFSA